MFTHIFYLSWKHTKSFFMGGLYDIVFPVKGTWFNPQRHQSYRWTSSVYSNPFCLVKPFFFFFFWTSCQVPSSPLGRRCVFVTADVSVHLYLNIQGPRRSADITKTVACCLRGLRFERSPTTSAKKKPLFCLKATLKQATLQSQLP